MGLGTGKRLAVLACDAQHQQLAPGARALAQVHGLGVGVADAGTGATIAEVLQRRSAPMGRPATYRKAGGSELQKAVDFLAAHGLRSPGRDDSAPAVAGRRKGISQEHPRCATFLSACGRLAGTLKPTMLACLAPPQVRTNARFLPGHRFCPWAERVRQLSPPGGAKSGSP